MVSLCVCVAEVSTAEVCAVIGTQCLFLCLLYARRLCGYKDSFGILSVCFSIMNIVPAIAGFLGPGRITLGAHFGGVDGDRRPARCSLLKTKSKVPTVPYRMIDVGDR